MRSDTKWDEFPGGKAIKLIGNKPPQMMFWRKKLNTIQQMYVNLLKHKHTVASMSLEYKPRPYTAEFRKIKNWLEENAISYESFDNLQSSK